MWGNSFSACGDGCCPCRGYGGGRHRVASLPVACQPISTQVQLLSTELQVCCTDRLVRVYNNITDERDREILEHWLCSYITFFGGLKLRWDKERVAEEFAQLANIQMRLPCDRELLYSVLHELHNTMEALMCAKGPIPKALSHVLASLDVTVFNGNPNTLLHLADTLTRTLQGCFALTRETFKDYRPTLVALYQTCTVVHRITPELPACNHLTKTLDGLLEGLTIFRDSPHYPFRFYAMLIEQSIYRFTKGNESSALFEAMRRFATGTAGVLYLLHGFRSFINIDIDLSAVSEGIQRLKAACADDRFQRKLWFDWLQAFSFTAMLCLTDPEKFESFQESLEQILEYQNFMRDREERKAIRYGIVNELMAVATVAESAEVRREAMLELEYLARCRTLSEGWYADPEVYEGSLDAASKVYQRGEFCSNMKAVLEMLMQFKEDHREIVHSWLGNKQLESKLISLLEEKEELRLVHHGQLLQRVTEVEMSSCKNGFRLDETVHDRSFGAVNAVHQV